MRLPARIGVLGTGAVSHQYLPNLLNSPQLAVVAVADIDASAARDFAEHYGLTAWTPEQLLASDDVDIVLNLTPIAFHVPVTRSLLEAGKHVYSEKSLALTTADANELLALAESKGLSIAGAPDTLLGSSFQAARAALASGAIGKPLTATALMLRMRHAKTAYYAGHNAFFDMAPYYVSALATLFGPVAAATAAVELDPDEPAENRVATGFSAVLEFASGFAATLAMYWGSDRREELPVLDVYGSAGILRFGNPNSHGDPAYVRTHDEPTDAWREVPGSTQPTEHLHNLRGLGVSEMAEAIAEGREPRASGRLAAHVVDVVAGLVCSNETGRRVELSTTFEPPAPLPTDTRNSYIGSERSTA